MTEPKEEAAERKPFQYSLRSLFVVTTIAAVLLGLAKMYPRPAFVSFIALLVFLPFFVCGGWLIRNDERLAGIGCLGSGLLMVLPLGYWGCTFLAEEGPTSDLTTVLCLLSGVMIISLPMWLAALFSFTIRDRHRKRLLRRSKDDHDDVPPADEVG